MSLLQKSSSVELKRRTQEFFASETSHGLGRTVRIECPIQTEYVDPLAHWLVSRHEVTNSSATDTKKQAHFAGLKVQNLRVKTMSGSMIGNEIREYRAGYQFRREYLTRNEKNVTLDLVKEGSVKVALTASKQYATEYAHKIDDHMFALKEYLPFHYSNGYTIEYDLPSEVKDLYTSTTLPAKATIFEKNSRIVTDLVMLKPEIEEEMNRLLNSNQLFVDYGESLVQQNTLQASSGQQAFDLVGVNGRIKAVFTFAVRTDQRDGTDGNGLFESWLSSKKDDNTRLVSSYRFRVADRYVNYKAIEVNTSDDGTLFNEISSEQLFELEKALDMHMDKDANNQLIPSVLRGTRFAIGAKVAKAQMDIDDTISSAIDRQRNNVRVEINFAGAPDSVGQFYTIVMLDKRVQFLPGAQVQNVAL